MNKKTKKPILIILVIFLILIIALFVVVKGLKSEDIKSIISNSIETTNTVIKEENVVENILINDLVEAYEEDNGEDPSKFFGDIDILNSRNEYLSAKQCITDFNYVLKMLSYQINNQLEPGDNQDYAVQTINLIDKSQVELFGINHDNVYAYAGKYNFVAQYGYRMVGDYDSTSIFLFGYRIDTNSNNIEDYGYAVRYDSSSNTYSVFTFDYLQQKELVNLTKGQKIELYNSELVNNGNNIFKFINSNPFDIAADYLNTFKLNCIYKPDLAYSELNENYATKFGSLDNFIIYVNNNQNKLNSIILGGCDKVSSGSNVKYLCQDNNKNTFNIVANPNENIFDFKIEFSNIIF